jgi:hypothetical protein
MGLPLSSCPHLKTETPGSPLYLETVALVLWIKAAQLLDSLACQLHPRVVGEATLPARLLIGVSVESKKTIVDRLRERTAQSAVVWLWRQR